jgi:hypothetical protein
MALAHFHYLVTAFGLTIWTHHPFLVMFIVYAFQAIAYAIGISTPNLTDYIFWQFITAALGCVVGFTYLIILKAPPMLEFRASYVGAWVKFLLWLVFYVAAQLFYAFFPSSPFGVLGTSVIHTIIQVALWATLIYNGTVFHYYPHKRLFFLLWAGALFIMESVFYLTLASLTERWVALIAGGLVFILLLLYALLCPPKTEMIIDEMK